MRSVFFTIIAILVIIVGFGLVYRSVDMTIGEIAHMSSAYETNNDRVHVLRSLFQEQSAVYEEQQRIYHILAGGDVMLDRGVESKVRTVGQRDWTFPWHNSADVLRSADLAFVNFEGSMSDVGADTGKRFSFRFDPGAIDGFTFAGIDVVALANNHMLDWGRESLCATTEHLRQVDIAYVGAGCSKDDAEMAFITDLGETRVAFIAYTEFYKGAYATEERGGVAHYDLGLIRDKVQSLREQGVDVVLLSIHWGVEYETRSSQEQQERAKEFIDAGVDVVIGHHPHVAQEIERYGDGWIIYSLGNFIFDQYFSEETMRGLVADIQIQNGRVYDIRPLHMQMNEHYQPEILDSTF
jgi:poly-gamma-glutamate capsule biosynthesis protein CapA/YwtB (metallophosphatase superfamily)